jgi:sphingomyelin phosphodiesterase
MAKANAWYDDKADWLPTIEDLITIVCSVAGIKEEVCAGAIEAMGGVVMGSIGKHYLDKDYVCY